MREERIQYFTEKEEEFTKLLIEIGTKKNVAKLLVFLSGKAEASSREIEHGADMRQAEVSTAMKYLKEQGWIKSRKSSTGNKGRRMIVYKLAKSVSAIIDSIESGKKNETRNQLALIRKLRESPR